MNEELAGVDRLEESDGGGGQVMWSNNASFIVTHLFVNPLSIFSSPH